MTEPVPPFPQSKYAEENYATAPFPILFQILILPRRTEKEIQIRLSLSSAMAKRVKSSETCFAVLLKKILF